MRELVLLRHAKAEPTAPGGDRDRPLSASGRLAAARMGAKLAAEGVTPDLALVSSAVRTQETWRLASAAFPGARLETRDDLYDADPDDLAAAVSAAAPVADVVILVGHNPAMQTYALELLKKGGASTRAFSRVAAAFPPATAIVFAVDTEGRPSFEAVYDPRDLEQA